MHGTMFYNERQKKRITGRYISNGYPCLRVTEPLNVCIGIFYFTNEYGN